MNHTSFILCTQPFKTFFKYHWHCRCWFNYLFTTTCSSLFILVCPLLYTSQENLSIFGNSALHPRKTTLYMTDFQWTCTTISFKKFSRWYPDVPSPSPPSRFPLLAGRDVVVAVSIINLILTSSTGKLNHLRLQLSTVVSILL